MKERFVDNDHQTSGGAITGDHTPGPWHGEGEIIGNSRIVATMAWCSGFDAEDRANARLVRAAPDLLAALNAAHGYMLNAAIDLSTGAPKRTALQTIEGGIKLVREAVAKATVARVTAQKEPTPSVSREPKAEI